MGKILALAALFAAIVMAMGGCESKDPHEPNLKGQPNPNYPPPSVGIGGGGPPPSQGAGKTEEGKAGEGKEGEGKTEEKAAKTGVN